MKNGELPQVYASLAVDAGGQSADFWLTDGEASVTIPLTRQQAAWIGKVMLDYAAGRRDMTPVAHEEVS